jgi:hypothetical protein
LLISILTPYLAQQNKIQKKAQQELNNFAKNAKAQGAKYGVKIDINKIAKQLQKEYQATAQQAFNQAKNQAETFVNSQESTLNNIQNKNQNKINKFQNQANRMTFSGALNKMNNLLAEQVNSSGANAEVTKSLNALLAQGKTAAIKNIKAAGFQPNANIKRTATKEFNQRKGAFEAKGAAQQKKMQQRVNAAIRNL